MGGAVSFREVSERKDSLGMNEIQKGQLYLIRKSYPHRPSGLNGCDLGLSPSLGTRGEEGRAC